MKRNAIMAVLIAVLLCPLLAASGSCGSNDDTLVGYLSDDIIVTVNDGKNVVKYKNPSEFHVEIGNEICATKKIDDDKSILLNGEEYVEGTVIVVDGSIRHFIFCLDTICTLCIFSDEILRNTSCFDDWEQYSDFCVKRINCSPGEVFVFPTSVTCTSWDKEFVSWRDQEGNIRESIQCSLPKYYEITPNLGYHSFIIYFHDDLHSLLTHKTITNEHFEVPTITDDNFIGWFYKDQNGNECEFKKGVVLEDEMDVYAKYEEAPVIQENNTDEPESKDTNPYSILTNNGLKISDDMAVESIAASAAFVMLALVTFLFFFRRH